MKLLLTLLTTFTAGVAFAVYGITFEKSMPLEMDYIRVIPRATKPADCTAAINGAIYYDTTGNDLCVCQNTTWTTIDGGGTCA